MASRAAYVRRYRAENRERFIAYQRAYRIRNAERIKERDSQPARRARARQRASEWYYANRERALRNVRKYIQRTQVLCEFCHLSLRKRHRSCCKNCIEAYGRPCRGNVNCGVRFHHKHCPCGLAVPAKRQGHCIEPCPYCLAEMERLGVTLAGLYQMSEVEEKAA